jgi:hypothetical protein
MRFSRREPTTNFARKNAETQLGKSREKDALRVPHGEALLMGLFLQVNQWAANHPLPPIWAPSFERRLRLSKTSPTPSALLSLTARREGSGSPVIGTTQIIGDDRLWRVNTEELLRQRERRPKAISWLPTAKTLRRPIIVVGRNDPVRDVDDALRTVKGFRVRICIESEKELQILGCGWRIVTCQLRGKTVLLHHNGNVATMKRPAFKGLLATTKRLRRKRPALRLVVSNSWPSIDNAVAA